MMFAIAVASLCAWFALLQFFLVWGGKDEDGKSSRFSKVVTYSLLLVLPFKVFREFSYETIIIAFVSVFCAIELGNENSKQRYFVYLFFVALLGCLILFLEIL